MARLKLDANTFGYLRSLAEGHDIVRATRQHFVITHASQIPVLHRAIIDVVRAIARRNGDLRWPLVGMELRCLAPVPYIPSFNDWARREGVADWPEAELIEWYVARFATLDSAKQAEPTRNERLVAPCLQLLQALEQLTAQDAHLTDLLGEWITPALTDALRQSGMTTLADLQACIKRGGRWWSVMPGMGPGRARRLDAFVRMLLPPDKSSQSTEPSGWQTKAARARLEKYGACARDSVVDDAVRSWVLARASHEATRALLARYSRDADRFMLWCLIKRGKSMLDATAEDCHAYMEFVANLPDAWISPTKVARLAPGWAPFNKAPTFTSRHQSFAALHSLFAWLVQRRSRASNPWATCDSKSLGHAKAVFAELQGFAEVTVTGRVDEAAIARFRRDVLGHLLNHDTHGIVVDLRAAEIAIDTDSMPLGNVDPAYRRVGSRPVAVVTTAQSEALFIKWAWFMQYVSGMAGRPAARARRGRNSGSS